MRILPTISSATAKAATQAAAVAVPGLGGVGELIATIIALCDAVPQNRYTLSSQRNHLLKGSQKRCSPTRSQMRGSVQSSRAVRADAISRQNRSIPNCRVQVSGGLLVSMLNLTDDLVDVSRTSRIRCRGGPGKAGFTC